MIGSNIIKGRNDGGKNDISVVDILKDGKKFWNLTELDISDYFDKIDFLDKVQNRKGFENVEAVFHKGACSNTTEWDGQYMMENNYEYSKVLLHYCLERNIPFFYASSAATYGDGSVFMEDPKNENPINIYGYSKYLFDQYVRQNETSFESQVVGFRYFNVYGPRSRTSGTYGAVVGVFLGQKLAGKPFTVVGNGEQSRDFTYVTDIVQAIVTAAKSGRTGQIYNVGSGVTVSVNRLVELLGGDKVLIPKRPGEPDSTFADISKIRTELGWEPQVSIEEGMAEILKHIDYWRDAPVWSPDSIAVATEDWFRYLS